MRRETGRSGSTCTRRSEPRSEQDIHTGVSSWVGDVKVSSSNSKDRSKEGRLGRERDERDRKNDRDRYESDRYETRSLRYLPGDHGRYALD